MTPQESRDILRPLNTAWLEKIKLGIDHKKAFDEAARQCMAFYKGSLGFMWEDEFWRKYLGKKVNPQFKLTIAKAFELVALFGPVLYHRNPVRIVRPYKPIEFPQQLFGDPNDPNVQQQYQMMMQQEGMGQLQKQLRCQLMETYFSYTPREQPNGGLEQAGEDAITEALIKGRGLLWAESYTNPHSPRKLTGLFYDSVDNLVTDPDATTIAFGDTQWIARRHTQPTWIVEKRFGLEEGALKDKGQVESAEATGARRTDPLGRKHRSQGQTFDLMTYWEIYSIGGVGTRLTGMAKESQKAFNDVIGDYAYIAVADGMEAPLNCPEKRFLEADDDEVKEMFAWPAAYWADQRWPVTMLDFYRVPGYSWPMSPLAPGLGELTAINILISFLADRVYSGARDFVGVLESAADVVEKAYARNESVVLFRLPDLHKSIDEVVSFLKQPPVNLDVYNIIERLFDLFNRRVGLNDLLYGMNPGDVQSRTATDINAKRENLSVRPDYMSKKVAQWLTEGAELEKICAYWSGISGQDVAGLMGGLGAQFWDRLFAQADPEVILHQMYCTVEADTVRKPNKARDVANVQQIYGQMLPLLGHYADVTTDTNPINALHKKVGEAIEQDMSGLQLGPLQPPPPPPGTPDPAQMEMQLEQQKAQLEMQKGQQDMAMKGQAFAMKMQQDQQSHALKVRESQQEMKQDAQQAAVKLAVAKAQARIKRLNDAGKERKSA